MRIHTNSHVEKLSPVCKRLAVQAQTCCCALKHLLNCGSEKVIWVNITVKVKDRPEADSLKGCWRSTVRLMWVFSLFLPHSQRASLSSHLLNYRGAISPCAILKMALMHLGVRLCRCVSFPENYQHKRTAKGPSGERNVNRRWEAVLSMTHFTIWPSAPCDFSFLSKCLNNVTSLVC